VPQMKAGSVEDFFNTHACYQQLTSSLPVMRAGITVRKGDLRLDHSVDIRPARNIWQRQDVDHA
jgi:hypothetical protein